MVRVEFICVLEAAVQKESGYTIYEISHGDLVIGDSFCLDILGESSSDSVADLSHVKCLVERYALLGLSFLVASEVDDFFLYLGQVFL